MDKIFTWDNCPNIDMLDESMIWWNEEYICIRMSESMLTKESKHGN
jgi:hypothetical protein